MFCGRVRLYGARLLCSGIGIFQRAPVEQVLAKVDVAVLNFGLHYHDAQHFEGMLRAALLSLSAGRRVRVLAARYRRARGQQPQRARLAP